MKNSDRTSDHTGALVKQLIQLMSRMNQSQVANPASLYEALREGSSEFLEGRQVDFHEVFNALINGIEKETEEESNHHNNIIYPTFYFDIQTNTSCSLCNHVEVAIENMKGICLPIKKGRTNTLNQCIKSWVQNKIDDWRCNSCGVTFQSLFI